MAVRLFVEAGPHPGVSRAAVVRGAHAMLEALQMTNCELSILLTGDSQIAVLNRLYRKKNRPTDVLAFAQREGEHGDRTGPLLGDVVVSVETARRQAKARGAPLASELTMLLAHGLLHLLGWDHETPSKDRRMRRETTRLMEAAEAAQRDRVRRTAVKPFKGKPPPAASREPAPRASPRPPRARKARPRAEARLSATPTTRGRR